LPDDAILVDSSDEEIIVAEAPEDALAAAGEDMALQAVDGGSSGELVTDDPMAMEPEAAEEAARDEIDPPPAADEALEATGGEAVVSDFGEPMGEFAPEPITGENDALVEEVSSAPVEEPAVAPEMADSYEMTGEMPAYAPPLGDDDKTPAAVQAIDEEPVE